MLTLAILAFFLLFLHLDFFAVTLIILYVSAVTVLFIYIVLMVPFIKNKKYLNFSYFFGAVLFTFFLAVASAYALCSFPKYTNFLLKNLFVDNAFSFLSDFFFNQINLVGLFLYTEGIFYFLILTVIFFITLLGITLLAK
jgi:NADH:ubiquinone oxidoreductase subunit 6 (subunit J)